MSSQDNHPELNSINVVIVDDHPLMREGLRNLIKVESDLNLMGEASTGEQALAIASKLQPDVIILDINLPDTNGIQVTSKLKTQHSHIAVVLLTAYDDAEQIIHAMRAGASAYCPKDIEPEKLIAVIRHVSRGNFYIEGKIYNERGRQEWLNNQLEALAGPYIGDNGEHFGPLSAREFEILQCVTRGLSNKEIASELRISHQTVKNHMTSILDKLNVEDRTQAAVYALKRGWVRTADYRKPTNDED